MAEGRSAEAAGHRPPIEFGAGGNEAGWYLNVKINDRYLAAGIVGAGIVTLAAFYYRNAEGVGTAVTNALEGLADRVLSIRPGSVLVEFVCYTKETFLAFMDAFATGTVKEKFQEEFSKIGFKDELEMTVTVYDNASRLRKEMEERSLEFGGVSESDFGVEPMESGLEEMSSLGEVIKITPDKGPVKGGISFGLQFASELPKEVTSGFFTFESYGKCQVERLLVGSAFFEGSIPAAATPRIGPVSHAERKSPWKT